MGTKWDFNAEGNLVVEGLAKPFVEGTVEIDPYWATSIKAVSPRKIVVNLPYAADGTHVLVVISALQKAGYIDPLQKVTITQVDQGVALVTFEHQLPAGLTSEAVREAAPGVKAIAGHRTLTLGQSVPSVNVAIKWLWGILRQSGVVKGSCPNPWR